MEITSRSSLVAGYLAACATLVFNALSTSCVQALQGTIPDFQLSVIRSTIQSLTFFIAGLIDCTDFTVSREYIPGLIYFGILYLILNFGLFGAAAYLPLVELQGVVTIVCSLFAIAQSKLLFNKEIAKSSLIATSVCIVGILLVIQPHWMFANMTFTETRHFLNSSSANQALNTSSSHDVMLGYILSIIGGAAFGITYDVGGIILHNVTIIPKSTYTMLVCSVGSVACMFYLEDPVYVVKPDQIMLALGHALCSAGTTFFSIYAFSILPGPSVAIVLSLDVITMLVSQYTVMHSIQPGNYNWVEVFGCLFIVFGAGIPGVMDLLAHRAKANELP